MSKLNDIEIDNIQSQNISYSNNVTEKAIEDGEDITDHLHLQPKIIDLDCIIKGDFQNKKQKIKNLRDERKLIKFYDSVNLKTHKDLVVTSLKFPENKDMKDGLKFNISLQEVIIAEKSEEDVRYGKSPTGKQPQKEQERVETADVQKDNIDEENTRPAVVNRGVEKG